MSYTKPSDDPTAGLSDPQQGAPTYTSPLDYNDYYDQGDNSEVPFPDAYTRQYQVDAEAAARANGTPLDAEAAATVSRIPYPKDRYAYAETSDEKNAAPFAPYYDASGTVTIHSTYSAVGPGERQFSQAEEPPHPTVSNWNHDNPYDLIEHVHRNVPGGIKW